MISQFDPSQFIITRQHKHFVEFCNACRENKYIGVCTGEPGVGKTWSAIYLSRWDLVDPSSTFLRPLPPPPEAAFFNTGFYTPEIDNSPKRIKQDISLVHRQLNILVTEAKNRANADMNYPASWQPINHMKLLLMDESTRLKHQALEQVRDSYDREGFGLVLIGMPGLEKMLARYPQLYSRVGFVFNFERLSNDEMIDAINSTWHRLQTDISFEPITNEEVLAAIIREARSNLRLLHRLLVETRRLLIINELTQVDQVVLQNARDGLVFGPV